mgnify:CR=1 FL=1
MTLLYARDSGAVPTTAKLAVLALTLGICLAIPLGITAAVFQNTWIDRLALIIAVGGQAVDADPVGQYISPVGRDTVNRDIRAIGADLHLTVIDSDALKTGSSEPLLRDGVHFTAHGGRLFADKIIDRLELVIEEGDDDWDASTMMTL